MATSTQGLSTPSSVDELGIRRTLLEELALKALFTLGEVSLRQLADFLCLKLSVTEEIVARLRKDQLCEVTGMVTAVPRYVTSEPGKLRALSALSQCRYVGPVPVSLSDYAARVREQSLGTLGFNRERFESKFGHLVLQETLLGQVGTAVVSGQALFLYGPPGSGKTSIAEAISSAFGGGEILVPYAVETEGQIITIFDPVTHGESKNTQEIDADRRWVMCHRPTVLAGGELTPEMLDLQFNPATRFYTAPLQMKANNGVLVIDDFGRQRMRPEELLNRWVVPLDRGIDFVALFGGRKLEIPFEVFVVFATNLEPAALVDEAFLRRIQTKVKVGLITNEDFKEIFRRVCESHSIEYRPAMVDLVIHEVTKTYGQPLRACHPRDLIRQIEWTAKYYGRVPEVTEATLLQACENYFVSE